MTESNVIEADFTVDSEETLEAPPFHPLLKVWQEVLRPAAAEAAKKVSPQWANRIVSSYAGVNFADVSTFRDIYFGKLEQLQQLLADEIATDEDCLSYTTPEEDVVENAQHYRNLLQTWQLAILRWELDWDSDHEHAAIELASISEVHKMFFGDMGIVNFLDNIKFEYTDADREELAAALQALKDGEGE